MARTIILGMNNPLSQRPEHALYPYPPGCTGHRILELIRRALPGATQKQYLAAFERRNLVIGPWSAPAARVAARALIVGLEAAPRGCLVLVLGKETWAALGLSRNATPLDCLNGLDGISWTLVSHPNGRNRWYNDEGNRAAVAELLARAYEEGAG